MTRYRDRARTAAGRVTFLKGSPDHTHVSIASGDGLVIEKCKRKCDRGYELEIEIVTPELARITVAEGGTIRDGGNITYWGDARVTPSIQHGGVVTRGTPADADKPLSEMGGLTSPAPPVPAVPPIKGLRHLRR